MNEFKRAREEYESTPIPEELDARVRAGIRQGRTSSRSRGYKVVRRTAGSVAACLAVLMAGLNVSPTFAAAAADAGGYVTADETTRTNLPGVYAVGDVRTKPLRQVVTAVADGAMAVHMAEEYLAGGA